MATKTQADNQTRYILCFYVPTQSTTELMNKICARSGAGTYSGGLYTEAYWKTKGTGQFRANEGSNPTTGTAATSKDDGQVEVVEEDKVEVLCVGEDCVKKAVEELKSAHPYEEVPYYVVRSEGF